MVRFIVLVITLQISYYINFLSGFSKKELISFIKGSDIEFIKVYNRTLFPHELGYLQREIFLYHCPTKDMENEDLRKNLKGDHFTRIMGKQFCANERIQSNTMKLILKMFAERDSRICDNHAEVNSGRNNYIQQELEMKKSIFLLPNDAKSILYRNDNDEVVTTMLVNTDYPPLDQIHRIYLTDKVSDDDRWILYVIDMPTKTIYFLDPKREINFEQNNFIYSKEFIENSLNRFMSISLQGYNNNTRFQLLNCPNQSFLPLDNPYDSGIYVATFIYFLVRNCPLAFEKVEMPSYRNNWAYWLTCGQLII
jgi:hypothetical protein